MLKKKRTYLRTYLGTHKGHIGDTNNNDNNIIFNLIINKYAQNPPQNYREKIKRIAEIKNSQDYELLTLEQQNELFIKLMEIGGHK